MHGPRADLLWLRAELPGHPQAGSVSFLGSLGDNLQRPAADDATSLAGPLGVAGSRVTGYGLKALSCPAKLGRCRALPKRKAEGRLQRKVYQVS